VSKNVLEAMDDEIEFGGLPWIEPGEVASYGINSLTSNILCQRHNSALSPLDAAAGKLFRFIKEIGLDLNDNGPSQVSVSHLMNGRALELWCLKALFGVFYGKLAANQRSCPAAWCRSCG
jgi:hypothetical protein